MGILTRFRRSERPAPAVPRYRRGDFTGALLGTDTWAVRRRGEPATLLPAWVVEFVEECEEFAPLDELVETYAVRHGWDGLQTRALQKQLPQAIAAGLLVSTDDLRSAWARGDSTPPPRIASLGLSTGGPRLAMVERCFRSFAANLQTHGRTADFLIAENSTTPHLAHACREAVSRWAADFPAQRVLMADNEDKRGFIRRLADTGACSPATGEFALLDPLRAGFVCGGNRNALLLQAAGQMLSSLDDDVVCQFCACPSRAGSDLSLFSGTDPYQRWLFADRSSALQAGSPQEVDYLALHERLLGLSGAALAGGAGGIDFSRVAAGLVHRLSRGPATIRATFSGHVGDPGIPASAYYLYYQGDNRRRLTASPAHYRAVFPSRSVLTACPELTVGDFSVSPGMCMGLDQRELLPPFFPVLHAEDFSFGAAVWQCCPDSLCGHLPLAVHHEPPPGKPTLTPEAVVAGPPFAFFEFAHLLRQLLFSVELPEAGDPAVRMQRLGRWLEELGRLPAEDFAERLLREALEQSSQRTEYLVRQLEEAPDEPEYWRDDVSSLVEHLRKSVSRPDFEIPFDVRGLQPAAEIRPWMQRLIGEYGRLLQAWPDMIAAARELRDRGEGLMRDVR